MRNLALHWQILIGMVAGTLLGIGLNVFFGSREVTVTEELPSGIVSARVIDTSARTEIRYVKSSGDEVFRVVDPLSRQDNEARSVDALESHRQRAARRRAARCTTRPAVVR